MLGMDGELVLTARSEVVGSVLNLAKGALGGGVLSGHVAYMKAGFLSAVFFNIIFGFYMGFCFYMVGRAAQIVCKRARVGYVTYPDVAEAAFTMFPSTRLNRLAGCYRHFLDFIICLNLFGSCVAYQLMIGKTIKQLVENSQAQSIEGVDGMPNLRIYVAIMIVPTILICLITELKYLAPFSGVGNGFVAFCICVTIYYARENNPNFENMVEFTTLYKQMEYLGVAIFSMSCAGVVIPVENNMKDPKKFPIVMMIGYTIIISSVFLNSFFGYVAFLDRCTSPITINYPMGVFPKILKALIGIMVYVTHAVNFFMPFNTLFFYIKKRHNQNRLYFWELVYRTIFVSIIGLIAIIFPNIDTLMSFLGCFCICNMAFIQPNVIYLLICWHRPGLGKMKWRLWRCILFSTVGIFIFFTGSIISGIEMVNTFSK